MRKKSFPFVKQLDSQDCGLACLRMIGKYFNENFELDEEVVSNTNLFRQGISISDLDATAKEMGFESLVVRIDLDTAIKNVVFPAIFFWNQNHFIVVYKIEKNKVYVADPAFGKTTYTIQEFLKGWNQNEKEGIIVVLDPSSKILSYKKEAQKSILNLGYVSKYLFEHKLQFLLISATLLLSVIIELIFPFFTQRIVDKGVFFKDVNFIYTILFAQIILFISKIMLEFYRSWLFVHISSRISLSIISDFLKKLMKLSLRYFNSKNVGDLIQRINDHKRIEQFLSKELIQTVFSLFSMFIYSFILFYFNLNIFLVVFFCTIIEVIWILNFLEKLKINDYKNFSLLSKEQNKIYEIINSIQEIKLNNLEDEKKAEWQTIQKKLYINKLEKLKIDQKYEAYRFMNFFQTILVIFFAAVAVMNGKMTIGTMLSVMFILGAINGPISNLLNFILQFKLVKVSFERLNEIHNKKEEENVSLIKSFDHIEDIKFNNVSFSYDNKNFILQNINILIPKNKTTAIVGVSGSGKTSLLKLLLKFYDPQQGNIKIGDHSIKDIDNKLWRNKCGVILQDSVIFSETIKYNVSLENEPDEKKINNALELANIKQFVDSLPLKEYTIIGSEGVGLSQGQRQRILIARAIYKNPDYMFFDEATNSLDSENEKQIVNNINHFFKDKTMVVVAHRLSTVKDADQILVLDNGVLIEKGTHIELVHLKGKYYSLIKNQLELGQ
ncbi:peptidase domain-containing ABC transporter [Flavobacterium sp. U410]